MKIELPAYVFENAIPFPPAFFKKTGSNIFRAPNETLTKIVCRVLRRRKGGGYDGDPGVYTGVGPGAYGISSCEQLGTPGSFSEIIRAFGGDLYL